MNELALFAGAGGGLLGGLLSGFRTVCAVEIEPYCREVLLRRQRDRLLPLFPIWDDVRTFDGRSWRGLVDVITAGFPCQPFSVAGRRRAAADDRNLWPDTLRVLREVRPRLALLENVPGLVGGRHRYFNRILGDLAEAGLDADWGIASAAGSGAPHRRKRLWVLAYPCGLQLRLEPWRLGGPDWQGADVAGDDGASSPVAYSACELREWCRSGGPRGLQLADSGAPVADANSSRPPLRQEQDLLVQRPPVVGSGWWDTEPAVGRVAHGVAHRVDRLRALGNGQVPAVAHRALRGMMERLHDPA